MAIAVSERSLEPDQLKTEEFDTQQPGRRLVWRKPEFYRPVKNRLPEFAMVLRIWKTNECACTQRMMWQ